MSITRIQKRKVVTALKKQLLKGINEDKIDSSKGVESPYTDLSKYRYTRTWNDDLFVTVYDYDVSIPDMPPEEEIVNYGLPIEEQIFRKTLIPDDLHFWAEDEKEAFIEREHHRRKHGIWFFIKGEPVYIPGVYYYFMNYWNVQTGKPVKFHMGDWKFFMIWMHVVRSPNIFGLLVFKCRRVGDTEKGLCIVYEYATRVRNTISQLYDCRTEKDMIKTFKRLKLAHRKMIWFMKPVCKLEEPSNSYEFSEPVKRGKELSNSFINEEGVYVTSDYEHPPLDSEITYYTNTGGADGARVGRELVDEFGKFNQIDPLELLDLSKKALEDDREGQIIGKLLYVSTIEELSNGKTLEVAKKLWEDSDPELLDDNGRTVSGMIRIVRGATDREKTDRWGYVNEEEVVRKIKADQAFLIKNKKWLKLIKYKRQNCLDYKDVMSNISQGSPFDLEKINNRHNELIFDLGNVWTRGELHWVDGKKPVAGDPLGKNRECKVYFEPKENGNYWIAWHPKDFGLEANAQKPLAQIPIPGNRKHFSCGIDPVSATENMEDGDKSQAGLVIKRNLDYKIDQIGNSDLFDIKGDPVDLGRHLKTNRYCLAYLNRYMSPNDNYDAWLKALVYYGSDFLIEKNHAGGFTSYLEMMGFLEYFQEKSGMSNQKGQEEKYGLTAGVKSIQNYFDAIATMVAKFANTIDIPLITEQLSTMEEATKTKHDIGVAVGFCEVSSNRKVVDIQKMNQYEEETAEGIQMTEMNYQFD